MLEGSLLLRSPFCISLFSGNIIIMVFFILQLLSPLRIQQMCPLLREWLSLVACLMGVMLIGK